LRWLEPAVQVLPESVPQLDPPAELRERLLTTVRADAQRSAERPGAWRSLRQLWRAPLLRPAAALAALAALAAGVAGYAIRDDGGTRTEPFPESAPGVQASLEIDDDSATLVAHGMPRLAKGAVYQVWVAQEGARPLPSSSFVPRPDGTAAAAVPEVLEGVDRVMVTREPGPNRKSPTLPAMLAVELD
jgi:hypothetical protein